VADPRSASELSDRELDALDLAHELHCRCNDRAARGSRAAPSYLLSRFKQFLEAVTLCRGEDNCRNIAARRAICRGC
jgi:hypothetical protein